MIVDIIQLPTHRCTSSDGFITLENSYCNQATNQGEFLINKVHRRTVTFRNTFKYKIISQYYNRTTEHIILSSIPINLGSLSGCNDIPIVIYPVSVKTHILTDDNHLVSSHIFTNKLNGSAMSVSRLLLTFCQLNGMFLIEHLEDANSFSIFNEFMEWLKNYKFIIDGITLNNIDYVKSMVLAFAEAARSADEINVDELLDELDQYQYNDMIDLSVRQPVWYVPSTDCTLPLSMHTFNTLRKMVIRNTILDCEIDPITMMFLKSDQSLSSDLCQFLSPQYNAHLFHHHVDYVNAGYNFSNAKPFLYMDMKNYLFHNILDDINARAYTDLYLEIDGVKDCDITSQPVYNYQSRYTELNNCGRQPPSVDVTHNNFRRLVASYFPYSGKCTLVKTWLEELFIDVELADGSHAHGYVDLALQPLISPLLVSVNTFDILQEEER